MALTDDIEELEGNKFLKQCKSCELEGTGESSEWCLSMLNPPIKKCIYYSLKYSIREANAIRGLYKEFPILDIDNEDY